MNNRLILGMFFAKCECEALWMCEVSTVHSDSGMWQKGFGSIGITSKIVHWIEVKNSVTITAHIAAYGISGGLCQQQGTWHRLVPVSCCLSTICQAIYAMVQRVHWKSGNLHTRRSGWRLFNSAFNCITNLCIYFIVTSTSAIRITCLLPRRNLYMCRQGPLQSGIFIWLRI